MLDYQVVQTKTGADIAIEKQDSIDLEQLSAKIKAVLYQRGLVNAEITIKVVAALARHSETGKLKRFVAFRE